jgi:translation initiation factor 5B
MQKKHVHSEFEDRVEKTKLAFAERVGLNTELYYQNEDPDFACLVPTSAITGEGLPDLVSLLAKKCQEEKAEELREKD